MGAESMEAAYESAMKHFKAAKAMKADECKDGKKEEEAGKPPVADGKDGDKKDDKKEEEADEKKESAVLLARIAALEERLVEKELNEHIENVLKESKLSMKATKIFKEGLGKIKSKTDFDKKFNDFKEMYLAVKGELESGLNPEKIVNVESNTAISFAGCVN
jgi:phage I-like protein